MTCLLPLLLATAPAPVHAEAVSYHGWANAIQLSNGVVDVVFVPDVGRVIRFGYLGGPNVLWENPKFSGQVRPEGFADWFNVGGDKVWPAEQAQWPAVMGRGWPPDRAFDGGLYRAEILPDQSVRLTSPVSPDYGLRAVRTFRLCPGASQLDIAQHYEKVAGKPVKTCIWNVSQTDDPDVAYVPVDADSAQTWGYNDFDAGWHANKRLVGGVLEIHRMSDAYSKYGSDSPRGWVAMIKNGTLFSEHCTRRDGEYPDRGCSNEAYTEQDSVAKMIELEILSPQVTLAVGGRLDWNIQWRLHRVPANLTDDARAAWVDSVLGPATCPAQPRCATQPRRLTEY
jgi:hypothetical protein